MLTRKHYRMIAKVIKTEAIPLQGDIKTIKSLIIGFVAALHMDNPQFDSHRFIEACGYDADALVEDNILVRS